MAASIFVIASLLLAQAEPSLAETSRTTVSSVAVTGRYVMPKGSVISDFSAIAIPGFPPPTTKRGISYEDLMGSGLGVEAEWDLAFARDPGPLRSNPLRFAEAGLYLSLGMDLYPGRTASDDFGDTLSADSWEYYTLIAGFKMTGLVGAGIFWNFHLGAGGVRYGSLNGDFSMGGGPTGSGQLIAASLNFAAEFGVQAGWRYESFGFFVGFDCKFMGGPRRGRNVGSSVSPDLLIAPAFEWGVEARF